MGIDDTDSRTGMCTTYLIFPLIEEIRKIGLNIIGYPRLVRLNPNIPWKTRGNGAISIRVGKGYGKKIKIGEMNGEELYAYLKGKDVYEMIDIKRISKYFRMENEDTQPGVVISPKKLPERIYWQAVRSLTKLEDIKKMLDEVDAKYYQFNGGRGIIGAAAAIAWRARKYTYELLAYLPEDRWFEDRYVDERSVIEMDRKTQWTFDNYDYENQYVAIKPNSRTPVLFGIRGLITEELMRAREMVKCDPYSSWIIYLTNQATDEHVVRKRIKDVMAYESVKLRGRVIKEPRTIEGGHVIFSIGDSTGEIDCAAYEPTKKFREIIKELKIGDEIEVYGGVRKEPFTVNLEKIRILKLKKIKVKVENPTCPICGRKMESIGREKGYRCRRCGIKVGEDAAKYKYLERKIKEGWYEVPVIARRHLARPLKLINLEYNAGLPFSQH